MVDGRTWEHPQLVYPVLPFRDTQSPPRGSQRSIPVFSCILQGWAKAWSPLDLCPSGSWAPGGLHDRVSPGGVGVTPGQESLSFWGHAGVTSRKHWGTPRLCRSSWHTLSPRKAFPVSVRDSQTAQLQPHSRLQGLADMDFYGVISEWQKKPLPLSHTLQTDIDLHFPFNPFHSSLYLKCLCRWTTREMRNGENLHVGGFSECKSKSGW